MITFDHHHRRHLHHLAEVLAFHIPLLMMMFHRQEPYDRTLLMAKDSDHWHSRTMMNRYHRDFSQPNEMIRHRMIHFVLNSYVECHFRLSMVIPTLEKITTINMSKKKRNVLSCLVLSISHSYISQAEWYQHRLRYQRVFALEPLYAVLLEIAHVRISFHKYSLIVVFVFDL